MGEIINYIRQTCETKAYQFSAICTNDYEQFSLAVDLDHYDGVIIFHNAASTKLVEKILNRGIAVIAVAFDYFPLDVPFISSDNDQGTELAFSYLYDRGHRKIAFAGDLTKYDLRKRYERFCELLDDHNLPHSNDQLICVSDTRIIGGRMAGLEFLERDSNCTAVICGAGHTTMGFYKTLEEAGLHIPEDVDIVGFDDVPFMRIVAPHIPYVDQNIDVIATRAIETLESIIHGNVSVNKAIKIAPTLCVERSEDEEFFSVEEEFSQTPLREHVKKFMMEKNYCQTIVNHSFESAEKIVASNLQSLMSLSPFFEQFMRYALLSSVRQDKYNRPRLKIEKIFTHNDVDVIADDDQDTISVIEKFPPKVVRDRFGQAHGTCVHFPIIVAGDLKGLLSVYGEEHARGRHVENTSFTGFTSYLNSIVHDYAKNLTISSLHERLSQVDKQEATSNKQEVDIENSAHFEWDLIKGSVKWSEKALELLGFTTDLERNIYRNMDIFDRVHEDDESRLRNDLTNSLSNLTPMNTNARIKNAEGQYSPFVFSGEIIHEENSRAIRYFCGISRVN